MTRSGHHGSEATAPPAPPVSPPRGVRWPPPAPEPGAFDSWASQWHPAGAPAGPAPSDWHGQAADDDPQAYGRPAWLALLVMVGVTAIGVVIDVVRDATGGVNIAIIVGALVAILLVRRVAMFPVIIAPPLVYMLGSAAVLFLRSGGPHNKTVLIDIATNWLVYGFPAMAAATVAVLIVAAIRLATKR